jgi:acetyl-CoA C-acetyltransferase
MDTFEVNEAFASVVLAWMREVRANPERVNPNGGAIALGHPVAATGSVITTKLLGEMEREGHDVGLVTLCIGGGQGIAMLIGRG